jgi:hypothetical protein
MDDIEIMLDKILQDEEKRIGSDKQVKLNRIRELFKQRSEINTEIDKLRTELNEIADMEY